MKRIKRIIYRYLTNAEFYNIYKLPGSEKSGGGQKYIDFPTSKISINQWEKFFGNISQVTRTDEKNGPRWAFPVYSIGLQTAPQNLDIYQRRAPSVAIGGQHLHVKTPRRISVWHPEHGFPEPEDPQVRDQAPNDLVIYLVETKENEVWAGWYQRSADITIPFEGNLEQLKPLLDGISKDAGMIEITGNDLVLNETTKLFSLSRTVPSVKNERTPKDVRRPIKTEEELAELLLQEDSIENENLTERVREITRKVKQRNTRAVDILKKLYKNKCQISGERYCFKKKNGDIYSEAHHLIPLGVGGADSPYNIVIISPLIHRMLHYAQVLGLDLSKIKNAEDGSATLDFTINGDKHVIWWHPKHAERVNRQAVDTEIN